MEKALIVGANGGIGLALVSALLETYPQADIIATWHRTPPKLQAPKLRWVQLDATSADAVTALSSEIESIDWLINAVGMLHDDTIKPEKQLKQIDAATFLQLMTLNTLPTLLLAQAFERQINKGGKFAVISARVGSIEDNRLGGWYSYRCSKAALNMAVKNISIEWQRKQREVCVLALHPGTTDTALSAPFQPNVPAGKLFTPEFTANALLEVIRTSNTTGQFLAYDGSVIAW
uniref:SDR family NAD(P)-dependent oxidoreductase n=1 Tax=Thaumasiovibrio occultus TaxID=1891184 RepID=UPI000B35C4A0|nr:SDR family NAD(P)-dependent oxidoreductase [Thaumasiovibrio occultus]